MKSSSPRVPINQTRPGDEISTTMAARHPVEDFPGTVKISRPGKTSDYGVPSDDILVRHFLKYFLCITDRVAIAIHVQESGLDVDARIEASLDSGAVKFLTLFSLTDVGAGFYQKRICEGIGGEFCFLWEARTVEEESFLWEGTEGVMPENGVPESEPSV